MTALSVEAEIGLLKAEVTALSTRLGSLEVGRRSISSRQAFQNEFAKPLVHRVIVEPFRPIGVQIEALDCDWRLERVQLSPGLAQEP